MIVSMSVRMTAVVHAIVMVRMMVMMAASIIVVMIMVIVVTASSLVLMCIFVLVLMSMLMGAGIQRMVPGEKVESSQYQKSDPGEENIDVEGWIEVSRDPSPKVEIEKKDAPYQQCEDRGDL